MTLKRSITLHGHRTSVSLENDFWEALQEIAQEKHLSLAAFVQELDALRINQKPLVGLSSFIRSYVLNWYRQQHKKN